MKEKSTFWGNIMLKICHVEDCKKPIELNNTHEALRYGKSIRGNKIKIDELTTEWVKASFKVQFLHEALTEAEKEEN